GECRVATAARTHHINVKYRRNVGSRPVRDDRRCRIGQQMRIGINAALYSAREGYRQTGISRYISELIEGLERVSEPGDEVRLFGQHTGPIKDNPMARILWEQSLLPVNIAANRLSVFHTPIGAVPMLSIAPTVVTVHDLAFLKYPDQLPQSR